MKHGTYRQPIREDQRDQGTQQVFSQDALEKALSTGGCVICAAVTWSEWKGIHSFLYEGMMFPHVREQFLDGGGFCAGHFEIAQQIERESWQAGGIGMAILCEDLIKRGMRAMEEIAAGADDKSWRFRRESDSAYSFRPGASCMFCEARKEKERTLPQVLEELLGEMKFRAALENSGLCLWHGQLAASAWKEKSARDWIAGIMRSRMEKLADDLQEFVRRHDYQRRAEAPGQEQDSVDRARQLLLGTRR